MKASTTNTGTGPLVPVSVCESLTAARRTLECLSDSRAHSVFLNPLPLRLIARTCQRSSSEIGLIDLLVD